MLTTKRPTQFRPVCPIFAGAPICGRAAQETGPAPGENEISVADARFTHDNSMANKLAPRHTTIYSREAFLHRCTTTASRISTRGGGACKRPGRRRKVVPLVVMAVVVVVAVDEELPIVGGVIKLSALLSSVPPPAYISHTQTKKWRSGGGGGWGGTGCQMLAA